MPGSKDARSSPRHHVEATADVVGTEVVLNAEVHDISLGGCQLRRHVREPAGTRIELIIAFAKIGAHQPISGIVVHASDDRMGVRFEDLLEDQKWSLRRNIDACLSRPDDDDVLEGGSSEANETKPGPSMTSSAS